MNIFYRLPIRQYSTESQQSGNYVTGNSIKEKGALQPKTGEKLIEVEKAETGSVRENHSIYYIYNTQ